MLKELDSYDWEEAFKYASKPEIVPGWEAPYPVRGFSREDVVEILGLKSGENEGPSWILACRLADGRFAFLTAHCDYTGWG